MPKSKNKYQNIASSMCYVKWNNVLFIKLYIKNEKINCYYSSNGSAIKVHVKQVKLATIVLIVWDLQQWINFVLNHTKILPDYIEHFWKNNYRRHI